MQTTIFALLCTLIILAAGITGYIATSAGHDSESFKKRHW